MGLNGLTVKRNIDIVFVIDGTASMTPCLDSVKNNAKKFYQDFCAYLQTQNSSVESLRVKVIVFRDYEIDADAMVESSFFELPDDTDDFEKFLNGIEAHGGGDSPENGLEALAYAMKSDFVTGGKDRQIIVLFTDTDALNLGERKDAPYYPTDLPKSESELTALWYPTQGTKCKIVEPCKRMIIYAPEYIGKDKSKYASLPFNRLFFKNVNMNEGLGDINFDDIIKMIAASASAK